jgi:hypothetical protein
MKNFVILLFQIQILGFNSQLYQNFSDALYRAQGIVGISLLLQVSFNIIYYIRITFSRYSISGF